MAEAFVWDENLLLQLLELINSVILSDVGDHCGWIPDKEGLFTVKSTFFMVSSLSAPIELVPPWHASVFTAISKDPAPAKVTAFAWQLLHNRVPTRQNLYHRHIIEVDGNKSCVLCGTSIETTLHLLLYFDVALMVWKGVFEWLDLPLSFPHNFFFQFYSS
jgi:hypothetical protein